jgi:hypothetical protein
MGGFSLILLIVGSLATGATRHQIYTGFRSRLGGRIATGFVSVNRKKERKRKKLRQIYFSSLSSFTFCYSFGYLLC